MKTVFTILSFLFLGTNSFSQSVFNIIDTTINKDFDIELKNLNIVKDSIFFEDSTYIVSSSCSGEWGGSVIFKRKKTGKEYTCAATCPIVINKINAKYYVTASLAHMLGFSKIIEIANPKSMKVYKEPKPRYRSGNDKFYLVGDCESKSHKGTNTLVDTLGIITIVSFVYKEQFYHIISDFKTTLLCKIENHRFVTIDTVSKDVLPIYFPEVYKTKKGSLVLLFDDNESKGYIEIRNNDIYIRRFKIEAANNE